MAAIRLQSTIPLYYSMFFVNPLCVFVLFFAPSFFIALVKSGQYCGDAANQERGGLYQRGAGQGAGGPKAQFAAVGPPADPLAPPPPEPRPQPSQSQQSQQPAAAAAATTTTAATATQAG